MVSINTIRDIIPERIREHIPRNLKDKAKEYLKPKFDKDIEKFKKDGSRFTPPVGAFPPMIMIDTTTRCNLQCAHCPNSILSGEPDFWGDLDNDIYYKIIDEIAQEAPATRVRLFDGGEPLLKTDLEELVKYAKDKGLQHVGFNTNGTLLNKKRRVHLIEAGLNQMEVSIDAFTAETYLKIRRSKLFNKVVENTTAFIQELKERNIENYITVSFVLQKDNKHEAVDFKNFWKDKAVHVYIREYHQHNNLVDDHGHFQEKHIENRHPCPFLWDRMIIYHDGRIRFCEFDWEAKHSIGNIQTTTIKEAWQGHQYQKLREQHIKGTFDHPYCKNCTDWREVIWDGLK